MPLFMASSLRTEKDYEDAALFNEFVRIVNLKSADPRHTSGTNAPAREFGGYSICDHGHDDVAGPCDWQRYQDRRMGRRATVNYAFTTDEYAEEFGAVRERERWYRERVHSVDATVELSKGPIQPVSQASNRGFVCAYCDAKYIYRRCLVNHLVKNHRKCIK